MALSSLLGRITRETYDALALFVGAGDARVAVGASVGRGRRIVPLKASGDVTSVYSAVQALSPFCNGVTVSYSSSPVQIAGDLQDRGPILLNEEFATDSDWTKGTGWTIAGGAAVGVAGSQSDLSQARLTVEERYLTVFGVTNSAGTVTPLCGATAGTARGSGGVSSKVYAEILLCATNTTFALRKSADFDGSVDFCHVFPLNPPFEVNTRCPDAYSRIKAVCVAGAIVDLSVTAGHGLWPLWYLL